MANWNLYDKFRQGQITGLAGTGAIDIVNATVKIALVTSTETPDQDADDFWSDASANEVSGTNYTAGGNAVANITVGNPTTAGLITVDGDDPATWSQSTAGFTNARRAILYEDTGTGTTSGLIAYSDAFSADRGNVDGDFSITLDAAGIFTSARS
jgi:hypothetical protein